MDLLHAKCRLERTFRDACIIALTETWLDGTTPDSEVSLDHFTILQADRTRKSGKNKGGGVCIFVNKRWCVNIKKHLSICTPDVELLTLSLRRYYLPREFPCVVISCVYIPPSANTRIAADLLAEDASSMMAKYPDAPLFILGDFNNCKLGSVMPSLHQYVNIHTRRHNTLDLCYGNISDAFTAQAQPPLGYSDHNVVVLLPHYRSELKRAKPTIHSASIWSEDAMAKLQGSLACTDWEIF